MKMARVTRVLAGIVMVLAAGLALPAAAKDKWQALGEFQARGDAKEVAVNRVCATCEIEVLEGSVIIQTFVIREGGQKTPITVAQRFEKGQKHAIDLGVKRLITGFRISDGAGGRYRVQVR